MIQAQPTYSAHHSNTELVNRLCLQYPKHSSPDILLVNIAQQTLYHLQHKQLCERYIISSAENGVGNQNGSGQTPLGAHCIQQKIGTDAAADSIFKGRQNTGQTANRLTQAKQRSCADYITSRILWLSGLEAGYNQGGAVDSYQRYIYIHGTDEEGRLGQAVSHGCIRMANQDVIALYQAIQINTLVYIYVD